MLESSITPAFVLISAYWWRKEEQGFRTGVWFCFNGFGQIFGACIAYGIAVGLRKNGTTTIAGWQIMFLTTGGLTVICGALFLLLIPESFSATRWLNQDEKELALQRVKGNQQGTENHRFKKYQMVEAVTDPMVSKMRPHAVNSDN